MTLKADDYRQFSVCQQTFEEPDIDLTFEFEVMSDGRCCLRLLGGPLPFGNREIFFDKNGMRNGSSTRTQA